MAGVDLGGQIHAWALALERSPAGQWVRDSIWAYPIANTLHVLGVAALVGAIIAFDLRLLGVLGGGRPAEAARLTLPVAKAGFILAVLSGLVLFLAEASAIVVNTVFIVKFAAIGAALLNIVVFHLGAFRSIATWAEPPAVARCAALVSLATWLTATVCGRFAAYV